MLFFRSFKKYLADRFFRKSKPSAEEQPDEKDKESSGDKRGFSRHWISFPVIVFREGSQDDAYQEKAVLKDISGGGALFVSSKPESYYPGQLLNISIMLDGTHDVRARVQAEATVIRIHREETVDGEPEQQAAVAVQFDRSFEFERIDNNDYGSIG